MFLDKISAIYYVAKTRWREKNKRQVISAENVAYILRNTLGIQKLSIRRICGTVVQKVRLYLPLYSGLSWAIIGINMGQTRRKEVKPLQWPSRRLSYGNDLGISWNLQCHAAKSIPSTSSRGLEKSSGWSRAHCGGLISNTTIVRHL